MTAMQSFEEWLSTLPKWLQTAAADLIMRQTLPTPDDIARLADLCVAEVSGSQSDFSTIPAGAFDAVQFGTPVRLKRIESLSGINALDSSAALDFGDADLVVVYGHNGTGKSGFARLTKHAAGARARTELLANVFADLPPAQKADFVVEKAGNTSTATWTSATGILDALRNVQVFDTDVAHNYVTTRAEASYEPRQLRFLSALANICDKVKATLEARKVLLPTRMPTVPAELTSTDLASFLSTLKSSHQPDAVKARCSPNESDVARVLAVETALRAPDPTARLAQISKLLSTLTTTLEEIDAISESLSASKLEELTSAKAYALDARTAATEAANRAFEAAALTGVGEKTWQALWEAARSYSTQVAYQGCNFPHVEEGARCPLCQQPLDAETGKRLNRFEAFVKGTVEKRAAEAEDAHRQKVLALPKLPEPSDWMARFTAIPDAEQPALIALETANSRKEAMAAAVSAEGVPRAEFGPLREIVAAQIRALSNERELLAAAAQSSLRPQLEVELRELKMGIWAKDNLTAILSELERLKQTDKLDRAIRKTNTAPLTKKKGEIAESELTLAYQARFAAELRALGAGRLPIKPVQASKAKGKVEFSLSVVGTKRETAPYSVLSEGEARVVALAAFLADVAVATARTPFVFDDPISSLDQEFEERVVSRLLELARTRQVLVFTHRLSLLTLLREAVKGDAQLPRDKLVTMREIALRRIGARVGLATDTSVLESKVDKALNRLIDQRLPQAKKAYDAGNFDDYTSSMKAICSDIRILTERAVEEVLLNTVVVRFRRSVTTMNKLASLAKIGMSDCAFLDDIMTRFSCFEHSQPAEAPASIPEFDDVRSDAVSLRDWVVEFQKRELPRANAGALDMQERGSK